MAPRTSVTRSPSGKGIQASTGEPTTRDTASAPSLPLRSKEREPSSGGPPPVARSTKGTGRQALAMQMPPDDAFKKLQVARRQLRERQDAGIQVRTGKDFTVYLPPPDFVDAVRPAAQALKLMDNGVSSVPAENANQVHARILSGCGLLLTGETGQPPRGRDHALALAGAAQLHNRWVAHLGMDQRVPMPALEVLDELGSVSGMFHPHGGEGKPAQVQIFKAHSKVNSSTMAHESVHIPQLSSRARQRDVRGLPREGLLHAAPRLLQQDRLTPQDEVSRVGPESFVLYSTRLIEMQAFIEQLPLVRLSSSAQAKSPCFEASGLGQVADLLQVAGEKLNSAEDPRGTSWLKSFFSTPPAEVQSRLETGVRPEPSGKMDPELEIPSFMASAEKIFLLSDRFNRAMNSRAWDDADTVALQQAMRKLNAVLLRTPWGRGLNGEEMLTQVATALESAWSRVSALKGDSLRQPAGEEPTTAQHLALKAEPWHLLETPAVQVGQVGPVGAAQAPGKSAAAKPAGLSFQYAPGTALPALLDEKKACGFFEEVAKLRSMIRRGVPLKPEEVAGPVMCLAARLCGTTAQALPPVAWPKVHLYEAAPVIPHASGLTDGPHQKRKAGFDGDLWRLDVPLHTLRDNAHLEAQLTKLAFDLSEDMVGLMKAHREGEVVAHPEGINLVAMMRNRLAEALGEHVGAACEQFVADHPDSLAAKIRQAPQEPRNRLWHDADRPDLKETVRAGGAGAEAARRAYQAGVWQDSHLDRVAIRRALAAADWSQEVRRTFRQTFGGAWPALSQQARNMAVIGSTLSGRQVFQRLAEAFEGDEPGDAFDPAVFGELVSAGLLKGNPLDPLTMRWVDAATREAVDLAVDPATLEIRT